VSAGSEPQPDLPAELHETLAEVVSQYYLEGRDQGAIAQNLSVSRSTVSRMIS
jgi:DNA-binding transcriptional regulator LsrR (DeoR family)